MSLSMSVSMRMCRARENVHADVHAAVYLYVYVFRHLYAVCMHACVHVPSNYVLRVAHSFGPTLQYPRLTERPLNFAASDPVSGAALAEQACHRENCYHERRSDGGGFDIQMSMFIVVRDG